MVTQAMGGDDIMVVPTEGENINKVLNLNGAGGYVWTLLEKDRSFDEVVALMTKEYDVSPAEAKQDLTEFINVIRPYIII